MMKEINTLGVRSVPYQSPKYSAIGMAMLSIRTKDQKMKMLSLRVCRV